MLAGRKVFELLKNSFTLEVRSTNDLRFYAEKFPTIPFAVSMFESNMLMQNLKWLLLCNQFASYKWLLLLLLAQRNNSLVMKESIVDVRSRE